jgi:drug/metabolite transporter (DMT)-like permease
MPSHALALFALTGACVSWAFSFPLLKALFAHQQAITGHDQSWLTNQALLMRYVGGALLIALLAWWRGRRLPTAAEWRQAAVCAFAGGAGLFLQIDALNRTAASTVGFLTQLYVVVLPLVTALAVRRWPPPLVVASVVLAFAGVALLSGITPADLRPGLGELMTLGASLLFTGQILALGARRWTGNDGLQVTWAMFALMAAGTLPVVAFSGPGLAALPACYPDSASLAVLAVVVVVCTCVAYALMTVWQRHVTTTEAGIIYCSEAAFTAVLCLLLPSLLGRWLSVPYVDEVLGWRMVLGGGLILGGCVLVQFAPGQKPAQ